MVPTRRRFLKQAGGALVVGGVTALAGCTYPDVPISGMDVVDEGAYYRGIVPANSTGMVTLADEDVLENFLVDLSANATRVKFFMDGRDWTVRNVGIEGQSDYRDTSGFATFGVVAHGDCRIENVWAGDGSRYNDGPGRSNTGVWLSPKSTGNLTITGSWFEGWQDNAIYGSSRHPGNLIIEDSVAKDNHNANFRMGADGRNLLRNSLSVLSGTVNGGGGGRGVWGWYDETVEVEDCTIDCGPGAAFWAGERTRGRGTTIHVENTAWEGDVVEHYGTVEFGENTDGAIDPDWIPTGVVTSASDAAKGITYTGPETNTSRSGIGEQE